MNKFDAARILNLSGELNPKATKLAYRKACFKYHPDRNPGGEEMMKAVNLAFEVLKDFEGNLDQSATDYPDQMMQALNLVTSLIGLDIEVCGSWIWVGGNTKQHKAQLKEAGFWWAKKKLKWYFRPEDYRSSSRGSCSMEDIREIHGQVIIPTKGKSLLEG